MIYVAGYFNNRGVAISTRETTHTIKKHKLLLFKTKATAFLTLWVGARVLNKVIILKKKTICVAFQHYALIC